MAGIIFCFVACTAQQKCELIMGSNVTKTIGSGITKRTKVFRRYDRDSDSEEIIAYFRRRDERQTRKWAGVAEMIADLRKRRLEVMQALPNAIDEPDEFARHNVPRESLYWYLDQIELCALAAETEVSEGRYWAAVEQGVLIGQYINEIRMKQLWEARALLGQKMRESTKRGADIRRERSDADRYADVALRVANGKSVRAAIAAVALAHKSGRSTVAKSYYKEKRRLKSEK